jgi:mono/diheme cytochrome c family protein
MIKRTVTLILALMMVAGTVGAALALDGEGNSRKGKYLYRKNCRSCHSEGQPAPDLSPIDHTQAQWKKLFANYQEFPCYDEWKDLSEADLNDIYSYLYQHAKDSPSPAKCK